MVRTCSELSLAIHQSLFILSCTQWLGFCSGSKLRRNHADEQRFKSKLEEAFFGACETVPQDIQQASLEKAQNIAAEPAGDYFIGRRYYKSDYKFWGYVRRPGQPWSTAELVMLNEKQKLAPDRERVDFGSDNNYEYKLYGYFSGDKVYEPASNSIYPEFVLKGYQLISMNPPPIFKSQFRGHATAEDLRYVVEKPE